MFSMEELRIANIPFRIHTCDPYFDPEDIAFLSPRYLTKLLRKNGKERGIKCQIMTDHFAKKEKMELSFTDD